MVFRAYGQQNTDPQRGKTSTNTLGRIQKPIGSLSYGSGNMQETFWYRLRKLLRPGGGGGSFYASQCSS